MQRPPSQEVSRFLERLNGVRSNGSNWSARCPCRNDDQNPSLSIGQGEDGRVLVTCHRGIPCSVDEICKSVGMTISDLMPPREEKPQQPTQVKWTHTYDYRDENGELLFQKQRGLKSDGKKTFRVRRPSPQGGWEYNSNGVRKILYNLPQVTRAVADGQTIFVVEGEKDAETLNESGFVATTVPFGAGPGKWLPEYSEVLASADVVVIADKDDSGRQFATEIRDSLIGLGCTVELLIAPGPDGDGIKDVTDLLGAGRSLADLIPFVGVAPDQVEAEEEAAKLYADIADKVSEVLNRSDLSDLVKRSKAELLLAQLLPETRAKPEGRLVNWSEFVKEDDDDSFDWVIPNLLERQERLMVVASEGVGKTFLARQVALLSAAGIHPFTFERMPPIRTLMVDLENPPRIIRRTSRDIQMKSLHYGFCANPEAHLLIKPDGLDLMRTQDRAYLEEAIENTKPDLLFLGPIYKSFIDPGGRTSESIAIEIAKYFDSLRTYFNLAMWLEHHAPLGTSMSTRDLRPFGSAVWSRWPEFGLSLQPDPTATEGYVYEVRHFRGARDRRQFPTKMTRGKTFPFEVLEFARME